MRYSDELLDEIRNATDIVQVIGQRVKLTRKGANYMGLCPFHSEKTPSFMVSPDRQTFHCFGCGEGGSVFSFLMKYDNDTFQEAVEELASQAGIAIPEIRYSEQDSREQDLKSRIAEVNREAGLYFYHQMRQDRNQKAYQYFTGRGLSEQTIKKFGLGYALPYQDDLYRYLKEKGYPDDLLKQTGLVPVNEQGGADKFWNRAMIPIFDERGRAVGFGGRVMGKGEPKYLNSPETPLFSKRNVLFGFNLAKSTREPYLLLCEGYMDVISLYQAGFDNAVASLGTSLTEEQAALLKKRRVHRVVLTYDNDKAGIAAALRAIPILKKVGITVGVLDMEPYNHPDEFIREKGAHAFRERVDQALGSFQIEIGQLSTHYDMNDPESKTAFHRALARRLCRFSNDLERENYLEYVCSTYHIQPELMNRMMEEEARNGAAASDALEEYGENPAPPKRPETADGIQKAQQQIFTILVERPELFRTMNQILAPEDFKGELYQRVAALLWEQLESGMVSTARIVDSFINDSDEYSEISGFFYSGLGRNMTPQEQTRALEETVVRVKKASLERALGEVKDLSRMQELLRMQKELDGFHLEVS